MEQSVFLLVPDIDCEHCAAAIRRILGPAKGVRAVSVDVPAETVRVTYDDEITGLPAIIAALDESGYPVSQ